MRKLIVSLTALGILFAGGSAGATTIQLSDVSSTGTSADLLDASFDFTVIGNQLKLAVTNKTTAFDMVSVFFNSSNDVTNLVFTGVQGSNESWIFRNSGKFMSNPFGTFNHALFTPYWRNPNLEGVGPGDVVTFLFDITCAGTLTCDASDFSNASNFGGSAKVFGASHFIRNSEGDSPFGGTTVPAAIPEPGTALLLAAGLAGLALRRR